MYNIGKIHVFGLDPSVLQQGGDESTAQFLPKANDSVLTPAVDLQMPPFSGNSIVYNLSAFTFYLFYELGPYIFILNLCFRGIDMVCADDTDQSFVLVDKAFVVYCLRVFDRIDFLQDAVDL